MKKYLSKIFFLLAFSFVFMPSQILEAKRHGHPPHPADRPHCCHPPYEKAPLKPQETAQPEEQNQEEDDEIEKNAMLKLFMIFFMQPQNLLEWTWWIKLYNSL